jgi:hypothetical protein
MYVPHESGIHVYVSSSMDKINDMDTQIYIYIYIYIYCAYVCIHVCKDLVECMYMFLMN